MLIKTFKYFDLNGNDEVEIDEFRRVLDKLGISGFEDSYIEEIFGIYADKKTNTIGYKSFCKELFHSVSSKYENVYPILTKIRNTVLSQGFDKFIKFVKALRVGAGEENRGVIPKVFEEITQSFDLRLKTEEIEKLFFAFYELNSINYRGFINSVIEELPSERLATASNAAKSVLYEGITLDQLFEEYDPTEHPEFNESNAQEIHEFFVETFSEVYQAYTPYGTQSMTLEVFIKYFNILSFFEKDTSLFDAAIKGPFTVEQRKQIRKEKKKEKEKEDAQHDASATENFYIDSSNVKTLSSLKAKLIKLNRRFFILLNSQFIQLDKNRNKQLNIDEFGKALKATKVSLLKNEISYLYGLFENKTKGTVNYETVLRAMINMNDRTNIISKVYKKLESDKSNRNDINVNLIIRKYDAKRHPEVINENTTTEEVKEDFKSAISENFSQEGINLGGNF